MSAPVETSVEGYMRAAEGPGAVRRIKGARWIIAGAVLVLAIIAIGYANRSDLDYVPMSIHNPNPQGARALAQVAQHQGLDLRQIDALVDARITDPAATTLVISSPTYLQGFQAQSILDYPGPILVLGQSPALASAASETMVYDAGPSGAIKASCSHPDARAAGTIDTRGPILVDVPDDYTTCFESRAGAVMAVQHRDGEGSVTFLADSSIVTNDAIDQAGNAALALRLIGTHEHAVWYVGSYFDTSTLTWSRGGSGGGPAERADVQPSTDFLPPGTGNALYALALALGVVAWWRARRFGPLVHEPLPVVIRSAESTRGRARLYRAAGATGRAAASLRAAAALRMGKRLGVTRAGERATLVAAIVRASGWSREAVEAVLFGPPPQNESDMMRLISRIDTLENEVHRS